MGVDLTPAEKIARARRKIQAVIPNMPTGQLYGKLSKDLQKAVQDLQDAEEVLLRG